MPCNLALTSADGPSSTRLHSFLAPHTPHLMSSGTGSSANDPIDLMVEGLGEVLQIICIDDDSSDDDEIQIITPVVSKKQNVKPRNQPPQHPWTFVESYLVEHKRQQLGPRGATIRIGHTVEVERSGGTSGFLRVFHILKNVVSGQVRLRGLLFKRNNGIAPLLNLKLNEVFLHARIYTCSIDNRPYAEQGLEEFPVEKFVRKRDLTLTDKPIEELSFRDHICLNSRSPDYDVRRKEISDRELLCCRNVFIQTYSQDLDKKQAQRHCQYELRPLKLEEADHGGRLLSQPQPPAPPSKAPEKPVSPLKRKRDKEVDRSYDEGAKRHTFGDVFCGAGGASCGARMAGLEVKFGVDNDDTALNSYRENFPNAHAFGMEAQDFATRLPVEQIPRVDILHMSPPCQFFSQAHTTEGQNDEKNFAAIFTIGELVEKVKPRLATLEETSGILRGEHILTFYQALSHIVKQGYSLRWAELPCLAYGCPQPRRRLFLFASAPGVPLPSFPVPTHGPPGAETREQGLRYYTTLRLATTNIPRDATFHDPGNGSRLFESPREWFDPDQHSKRTMLTNNEGSFYHWSGLRKWTLRELACLQGFPTTFQFQGKLGQIRRQIGNAYPANVAEVFLTQCREVLKSVDGYRAARPRHGSPVILLDDDDDEKNVLPSIETDEGQEMRAPILPPLMAMRGVALGRRQRDTSVTIGPDDVTLEGRTPLPQQVMKRVFDRVLGGVMGDVLVDGGHEGDETLELADGDAPDEDAPVPNSFTIEESTGPREGRSSATIDPESRTESPSVAALDEGDKYEVMDQSLQPEVNEEDMGEDVNWATTDDDDTSDEDTDMKPSPEAGEVSRRTWAESCSPDPTVAARGMMRSMSLQAPYLHGEGEVSGRSMQGNPAVKDGEKVVIIIDDD